MAGKVARPRLVAHQGVRRSTPATLPRPATLHTTQRLPQGYDHPNTSATWSTSPQSRPITPTAMSESGIKDERRLGYVTS
ncbi:hypothetical protein Pcinc_033039 [Petrolisthes cinctipes]|uniref:Uncharacterized protein n=1 Tax=Petrolisthes cinctipes TaxID=88211 RepID=A0AAE1JZL3_PETCI|nr:hypothetical protein Pcinc_033039 [Petrolisthes cinctipes]